MKVLTYTLVSDGPTDANLMPIINWTLKTVSGIELAEGAQADLWRLDKRPKTIAEKLVKAVELYPCDVLFIHRDAEKDSSAIRFEEIRKAFEEARICLPTVAIVPVRMLESWLCFNEAAIRRASGNPNGKASLNLPSMKKVESRPDPKAELKEALRIASELTGRRLKKFDFTAAFWRIVDCIDDFSPLRELPSFQAFENSVRLLTQNERKPGFYGQ